jgi:endonuclease/exonuclease/phosphatase (EEP) superfamily protein YafD
MSKLNFLVVLLALAAGSAAILGFLGGSFWFFDLFNHFQVQYAWFLLSCGLILLARKSHRGAALAGVLALLPVCRIAPGFISPPAASGGGASIRVASFNVLASNRNHGAVIEWTRKTAPDAIFFTEVTDEWADALKELEQDYPHWINEGPDFAFFSKHPITSSSAELVSKSGFPLLKARLNRPAGAVTFIAGHPMPPVTAEWSIAMDDFMAELAREVAAETGPVIVVGDFNSSRWSYKSRPLLHAGLIEAAKGKSPGPTWRRRNPLLGIPIDRLLYRGKGMGCKSFEIGPDLGSDHRPVTGEFVW